MKVTCIICPQGCVLTVQDSAVTGNRCKRGIAYGLAETQAPMRTFSTSVPVSGGNYKLVSVKPSQPVPKESILPLMEYIRTLHFTAPINRGQELTPLPGTPATLIATRTITAKSD